MESKISIEQFDFSNLQTTGGYVQLNIHIGKMPPYKIKDYLKKYTENAAICKLLNRMHIPFDVVPFREFGPGTTVNNHIAIEAQPEVPEEVAPSDRHYGI